MVRVERGEVNPRRDVKQPHRPVGKPRRQVVIGQREAAARQAVIIVIIRRRKMKGAINISPPAKVVRRLMPKYELIPPRITEEMAAIPNPAGQVQPQ